MKALCLYVLAGQGHLIPAKAISEKLEAQGVETQLVNFFDFIGRNFLGRINQRVWRSLLHNTKMEKSFTASFKSDSKLDSAVSALYKRPIKKSIETIKPDFIIGTHPYGGRFTAAILKSLNIDIPVYYYASDVFNVPEVAISNNLRSILISTQEGLDNVIKLGQDKDKVRLVPFPLQKSVAESQILTKQQAREKLGLKDCFSIELNLGGEGLGNIDLLKRILDEKLPVQVIIVGGLHESTKTLIESVITQHISPQTNVVIAGFVNNVNEYYMASDIIVGRAGINTIVEAMYLHRPFLITKLVYSVISSASFIEKYKVGWNATDDTEKQFEIIKNCYTNPDLLADIEKNFNSIPIEYSADRLAKIIIDDVTSLRNL